MQRQLGTLSQLQAAQRGDASPHSSGCHGPCRRGGVCIRLSSRWWVESAIARYAPAAREPRRTPEGIVHSRSTAGKGGRETPVAGQQTDSTRAETRARQVSSSQRGCGTRGAAVECGCCAMRVWASQGCTQVERGAMWQRGWGAERGWVERRWVGSVGGVGLVRAGRAGEELRRCLRCSGAGARLAHSSGVSPCRGGGVCIHLSSPGGGWSQRQLGTLQVAQATAYARKHCSQSLDSGKGAAGNAGGGSTDRWWQHEQKLEPDRSRRRHSAATCASRAAAAVAMRVLRHAGCGHHRGAHRWSGGLCGRVEQWGAERGWVDAGRLGG